MANIFANFLPIFCPQVCFFFLRTSVKDIILFDNSLKGHQPSQQTVSDCTYMSSYQSDHGMDCRPDVLVRNFR